MHHKEPKRQSVLILYAKVCISKGLKPFHAGGPPLHLPPQLLVRFPQLGVKAPVNGGLPSPRGVVWEVRVKLSPQFLPQSIVTPVKGVGGHKGGHLCQHLHMYRLHNVLAKCSIGESSSGLEQSLMTWVVITDLN